MLACVGGRVQASAVASWVGSEQDGGGGPNRLTEGLRISLCHSDCLRGVLHIPSLIGHLQGEERTVTMCVTIIASGIVLEYRNVFLTDHTTEHYIQCEDVL